MNDSYYMIDRFLRNNLDDDDYAKYSEALDSLVALQPAAAQPQGDAREAFEAWVKKETPELDLRPHRDGGYLWATTQTLWVAWQAASTQGFDAHDMATAAADGFRDGVASTQASEPSAYAITEQQVDDFLEDYELRGEDEAGRDGCHVPTEFERLMLKDAFMGLLAEATYAQPIAPARAVEPLTERQLMQCIAEAGCVGTIKMSFESGSYHIDRPTLNATKLCRAIERAHGIGIPATTPTQAAQENKS